MDEARNGGRVPERVDVAVVGGGLAGLSAAAYAARSGATVAVVEARSTLGGRGRTTDHDGFRFNEGPHALYKAGAGIAALRDLGIRPAGGLPSLRARVSIDGRQRRSPSARAVRQVTSLLRRAGRDAADPGIVSISAGEWIDGRVSDPVGRMFAAALVRVSSYASDLGAGSADAAAYQLHAAMKGVVYLDGGWQQIVDALLGIARTAGVTVIGSAKVETVRGDGDDWVVETAAGRIVARSVVFAGGGPAAADRLLDGASPSITAAAAAARPVHAACLDLGLRRLPRPAVRFVLGVDAPTYASVHTPSAKLADHGEVLHVLRYEPEADVALADVEAIADDIQPGWRDQEAARQVGLRRVVAFDRPQPGTGMAGRPGVVVDDVPGVFVAGDWVGPNDLIGGAALASGRAAGAAAAAFRPIRARMHR